MLIEADLITEDQLKQAVIEHTRAGMKLGQYLVREGIVSGSQIADLISRQLKITNTSRNYFPSISAFRI